MVNGRLILMVNACLNFMVKAGLSWLRGRIDRAKPAD
jgi:hypothetical protein